MSEFNKLKVAVQKQFDKMSKGELFRTSISKDKLWDTYLGSFPEGTNPMFRERTEYDCQCCKQFIRACGDAVAIVDNKLVSIWDVKVDNFLQEVADAMSKKVKATAVADVFLSPEQILGTDFNHQQLEDGKVIQWEHFYYELQSKFVKRGELIGTTLSTKRSNKEVFKRSLEEISLDAAETVSDLISQNSIYKGEEHKSIVELFVGHKRAFNSIRGVKKKDLYCWTQSVALGGAAKVRNTAIGTLLVDISDGVELDRAVASFETKVAPQNYKRPTALITKAMIAKAQKKVEELGITDSLSRRYAVTEDITINNVLFANRDAKAVMNVFDELAKQVPTKLKKLDKVEEVSIETFISSILPKADNLEVMFENKHTNNLVSLIAPQDETARPIFKWDNNFSWAYNGEVTDSMKERVKKAGGKVDGVLRFSIQWNDEGDNQNDFDAHCIEPNKNLIYYGNKGRKHPSSGMLDVDIISPGNKVAVENITWSNKAKIQKGIHKFIVHNYSHNGGKKGFTAEIEYDGVVYSYAYNKELRQGQKVTVAEIDFDAIKGLRFIKSLPSEQASKEAWGINTNQFQKVKMIMKSPNHWDDKGVGNKHYFFMLEDCKNEGAARGFFNEFLKEEMNEHRKVFEVLGSKMKVERTDNQLSGVGFSSTQKNSIICKVSGSFARTVKVNF